MYCSRCKNNKIILDTPSQSSKQPVFNGTSRAPKTEGYTRQSTKKQQYDITTQKPQSEHHTGMLYFFFL